jgi:hypothetical protein
MAAEEREELLTVAFSVGYLYSEMVQGGNYGKL